MKVKALLSGYTEMTLDKQDSFFTPRIRFKFSFWLTLYNQRSPSKMSLQVQSRCSRQMVLRCEDHESCSFSEPTWLAAWPWPGRLLAPPYCTTVPPSPLLLQIVHCGWVGGKKGSGREKGREE